jgi:protein-disulfide isomerase
MKSKGFLAIIAILIIGTIAAIIFAGGSDDSGSSGGSSSEIAATDHVRGAADSPVVLMEYGDFQCPACAGFDTVMEELFATYGDRVSFVYRHFPLTQIHPNAMAAHRAAEAAGRQGKFFEMGHLLYQRQSEWSESNNAASAIEAFAVELGLDIEKYRLDVSDSATLTVINDQRRSGENLDVSATPTFFLNGEKIDNPQSLEEFQKLLDDKLNSEPAG